MYLVEREADHQVSLTTKASLTAQEFAVKALRTDPSTSILQAFRDEVSVIQNLSHPNIVEFVDFIAQPSSGFIVMEYCSGGDLRDVISSAAASRYFAWLSALMINGGQLSRRVDIAETYIQSVFVQLILALHHCHHSYMGDWVLLHRDIKPENGASDETGTFTAPLQCYI